MTVKTKRELEKELRGAGLTIKQAKTAISLFNASGLMVRPRKKLFGFLQLRV